MTTAPSSKRRTYDDACAAAHALDLVGERWALLVVRELLFGPKRFTDLRAGLPGVSPNVLAERLRGLEGAGVVRRRKLPPPAASRVYELTDWGRELEPAIVSLGRWGARSPARPREAALGVDSLMLSLRTMFDGRGAEGFEASYEIRLGEDRFRAEVSDGRFEVERVRRRARVVVSAPLRRGRGLHTKNSTTAIPDAHLLVVSHNLLVVI